MRKEKVAVIGYGALGRIFVDGLLEKLGDLYQICGVLELNDGCAAFLSEAGLRRYLSLEELLLDAPDYVVEFAGGEALKAYGVPILEHGVKLVAASIGALAEDSLYQELKHAAQKHKTKMYLISGAVGGFDVLQTIALMGEAKGKIENYKAPASLNGAPYLEGQLLSEEESRLIFQGSAREAIAGFPKNVNVAVASALASVGVDQMQVLIESVPGMEDNLHKITVENPGVRAVVEVLSKPDAKNPKSSVMTAWSAVALLKNLASPVELF
ncbi:MAG: aspartate dehydrogenase domain-containing protein [Lachnospiraceae bacterium]